MSRHCTTGRKHVYFVDGEALTKSVPLRWRSKKHPKATHTLKVMCRECGHVKVAEPGNMRRAKV